MVLNVRNFLFGLGFVNDLIFFGFSFFFLFFPTGPETKPLSFGPDKNRRSNTPDSWPGFLLGLRGTGLSGKEANLLELSNPEASKDASVDGEPAESAVEVLALTEAPEIEKVVVVAPGMESSRRDGSCWKEDLDPLRTGPT